MDEHTIDDSHSPRLARRTLLKTAAAASFLGAAPEMSAAAATIERAPDLIRQENERQGTTDWQLTYLRVERVGDKFGYRSPWIEGYASRASVGHGESIDLMVSTDPAEDFTIDVYRMGYYGGKGARLVASLGAFRGRPQPVPEPGTEHVRECQWEPATTIDIARDWPSGVYLAKLSLVAGRYQNYIIFIVRDDRPVDVLFQCSDNTWQAYNRWPRSDSLYTFGTTHSLVSGVRVSYDRPYGKYVQVVDAPLSLGSGEFLLWEFPLAYWLEREGYDVSYCSNTDVHTDPARLVRAKSLLSVGHDEYWSLEQFQNVKAAVEGGVNVAFLSGNTCCFVAPFYPSTRGAPNRIITRAGRYGGIRENEKSYMGPFWTEGPNESTLIGAQTVSPFNGSSDWTVTAPDHWLFAGTGMQAGEGIPGLVGWEFHGDPADIDGLRVVAEGDALNSAGREAHWTATIYPGPKGNHVFNASTIYWAQGLASPPGHTLPYSHYGRPHGPDARVEQITKNLLERFLG